MLNVPVVLPKLTAAAINELIPTMEVGQAIVYHVGSLMHDRLRGPAFQTVHGAAQAAWDAYERGEVTLVQRKLAPLTFEYIAIKRPSAAKVLGRQDGRDQPARRAAH